MSVEHPVENVEALPSLPRRVWGSPISAAFLIVLLLGAVIGSAVLVGYRAGVSERRSAAATAQADELGVQYQLAIEDMADGRYLFAVERLEYIESIDPGYPGVSELLTQARAAAQVETAVPTQAPTPTPLGDDVTPEQLFAEVEAANAAGDWQATVQRITALRAAFPEYEAVRLDGMLFVALRNRGIQHIENDELELGIFDLEQAEQIGPLDVEAQQYMQWASLYVGGMAYWGLNWPRVIEAFEVLYLIGPFFKDTMVRLHTAHVAFGDELALAGDPCGAAAEYVVALDVIADDGVAEKRTQAEQACAQITPTPEGGATPSDDATPGGTPDAEGIEGEETATTETPAPTSEGDAPPEATQTPSA